MNAVVWLWILLAVLVVIAVVVLVVMSRRQSKVRNRDQAAEMRAHAADDEQLLDSRRDRTEDLEEHADAARHVAEAESEHAESLRAQTGEADERAALASEQAEILDDEAVHSRDSLEKAVEDHDEILREADRRDPDVPTDRHGNRTSESQDVPVVPEEERLDIGDDYSGDEFAEPDAEYIDPVEHERMAKRQEEIAAAEDSVPAAEQDTTPQARHAAVDDIPRDEQGRRLDPYGNPVPDTEPEDFTAASEPVDDIPRDEQGRRLDPYGNPVPEDL